MLHESRLLAANPWVARRPIAVTEYHRMGEVGIPGERDRVELIEGELVAMSPIGSYHTGTVNKLTRSLVTSGEVEICRDPAAEGYAELTCVARDGAVEPGLLPGVERTACGTLPLKRPHIIRPDPS